MHKLRLLFLLAVVAAFGTTCFAQSQDGTGGLDDQVQNKFSDKDQDQAKHDKKQDKTKVKSDDGHRKHWWSLPHLGHKKHDKDSAARQPQATSDNKTASAKSVSNPPAPKRAASSTSIAKPGHRTAAMQRSERHHSVAAKTAHKNAAGKAHASTVAGKKAPAKARRNTVAATNHARRPAGHNCTSAEMKNGGCQAVQKHTTKTATRAS